MKVALACLMVMSLGYDARAACPDAVTERQRGAFAAAEDEARRCLARDGDDVATWLELSRALGYGGRWSEALTWSGRARALHPDDVDLSLWHIRLLAWSGRLGEAKAALVEVNARAPEVMDDRDTAMLAADLHFWSSDWPRADAALSSYLTRWPGDVAATSKLEVARRGASRITTMFEAALATSELADEARTTLGLEARVWDGLYLGVVGELRLRDSGVASATDVIAHGLVGYRGEGWSIDASLGLRLDGALAPELSTWIEPAVALSKRVSLRVRAWRLDFADAGTWVAGPGLAIDLDAWRVDLRYYVGLDDAGDASHSTLARVQHDVGDWTIELGAGGGDASDYLDAARGATIDGHWLVLGGLGWRPAWDHTLRVGYTLRRESAGRTLTRHEAGLVWQVRL